MVVKSLNYDFYKQQVDKAIKDCKMWNDLVRTITYTVVITETCDGQARGWKNYTNPREPQFANFKPNDGDPPNKSWSTQRSGGLYQQQPQFWGPDVMDPYKSTVNFLLGYKFPDGRTAAGLVKVNYKILPIHQACQAVQGSEFADGINYLRNIPFALELLKDEEEPVANYPDFDAALDNSVVPWGTMPFEQTASVESIRHNLWATNRAAYKHLPEQITAMQTSLAAQIKAFRDGNQEDIFRSVASVLQQPEFLGFNQTIQEVGDKVEALAEKVDMLLALLTPKEQDNA